MFTRFRGNNFVHKMLAILYMIVNNSLKKCATITDHEWQKSVYLMVATTQRVLSEGIHGDIGEHLTHTVKTTQFMIHP